MKKSTLITLGVVCTVFVVCCNKIKDLTAIEIDLPYSQSVTLPQASVYDSAITHQAFPSTGVHYSSSNLPVVSGQQGIISQYNTSINLISKFYMKSLSLIDSPSNAPFNYLDTAQIYICMNANDSTLIAHSYGIANLDTLNMIVDTTVNLKTYFLQDTFYFKFSGHFVSLPPNSLQQIKINTVMHLSANPLN